MALPHSMLCYACVVSEKGGSPEALMELLAESARETHVQHEIRAVDGDL